VGRRAISTRSRTSHLTIARSARRTFDEKTICDAFTGVAAQPDHVSPAIGSEGQAQYGCPDSFELHMAMEHDHGDHEHHHIGADTDLNGDGFICVKHVGNSGNNHVHIDNHVPLP